MLQDIQAGQGCWSILQKEKNAFVQLLEPNTISKDCIQTRNSIKKKRVRAGPIKMKDL